MNASNAHARLPFSYPPHAGQHGTSRIARAESGIFVAERFARMRAKFE